MRIVLTKYLKEMKYNSTEERREARKVVNSAQPYQPYQLGISIATA